MSGVNKAILIGRVGKDPEVRELDGGTTVASFSLATSEKYTNRNGERVEETQWHNIVVWRKLAEIVQRYVRKGQLLYLEGKITTRSWDDRDGNTRYTTEIVCSQMQMLGKNERPDAGTEYLASESANVASKQGGSVIDEPGDDLPF